jgi:hypothetical protein
VSGAAWCEECDTLVEDEDLGSRRASARPAARSWPIRSARPIPWYFKAMLVASVIYLGYRGYQGVTWVIGHVYGSPAMAIYELDGKTSLPPSIRRPTCTRTPPSSAMW